MRSATGRLYALALAIVAFFLFWAVVAARPWATAAPAGDERELARVAKRERDLQREAARAQAIVDERWRAYRAALAEQEGAIAGGGIGSSAAAPFIVASAPPSAPLTSTRSS